MRLYSLGYGHRLQRFTVWSAESTGLLTSICDAAKFLWRTNCSANGLQQRSSSGIMAEKLPSLPRSQQWDGQKVMRVWVLSSRLSLGSQEKQGERICRRALKYTSYW